MPKHETLVLGGGCFWCTEAVFLMIKGVTGVVSGYAGGTTSDPTHNQVYGGKTGHAQVIQLKYDPTKVKFEKILDVFFSMHNPTTPNRQGADVGSGYRSIILYTTKKQREISTKFIQEVQKEFDKPIVTEVKRLKKFYPAEKEHQQYYKRNRFAPYCMLVISPKVRKIKKKFNLK